MHSGQGHGNYWTGPAPDAGGLFYYTYPMLLKIQSGGLKRGYTYLSSTQRFRVRIKLPNVSTSGPISPCLHQTKTAQLLALHSSPCALECYPPVALCHKISQANKPMPHAEGQTPMTGQESEQGLEN